MIALLSGFSSVRVSFAPVVSAAFSGLLASSGLTPAQVREKLIADRPLWSLEIYRRAHERGEIDLDRIPPVVLSMPFDLMRHDMLMTYQPIPAGTGPGDRGRPVHAAHRRRQPPALVRARNIVSMSQVCRGRFVGRRLGG